MEPLTALGLAASVAQFIDFGSKLVGKTREIAKAGSSVSIAHLSTLTSDLIDINKSLESNISLVKAQNLILTKEEQALQDLVIQCNDIAQELVSSLSSLTINESQRSSIFKSVRAALKTVLKKERVDDLARRLSGFREQLTLRVLLLLNAHSFSQNSKLDASKNEIVKVVSLNQKSLKSAIEDRNQKEITFRQDERTRGEEKHREILAAIEAVGRGFSGLTAGFIGGSHSSSPVNRRLPQITAISGRAAAYEDSRYSRMARQPADLGASVFENVRKRILGALNSGHVEQRHAHISRPYQETFHWTCRESNSWVDSGDSLQTWLKTGRGCYWISGKARSGKSVLMKHILESQKTTEALQEWAGSSDLVVASFFFWHANTPPQKSQAAMLRALLMDILDKRLDLVPVLFPDLYRSIIWRRDLDAIEISQDKLQSAFLTLCSSPPEGLKICFIIDGIDEYEGNHHELSEFLSHVANLESIKILLSSRPFHACFLAFSKFPKLILQDVIYDDMKHYVEAKLGQNSLMQRLNQVQCDAISQLAENLVYKVQGDFLWVIHLVKRLLSGLQDHDTLFDLFQKLDEIS